MFRKLAPGKALFHRAAQQLHGGQPVAVPVEKGGFLFHASERRERDGLKDLLHRADAAGQGDEGVGALLHDRFALRHRLHADKLRAMLEKQPGSIEEIRHDPDDLPAVCIHAACRSAHHAVTARTEHERMTPPGDLAPERFAERHELRADLIAGGAENTDVQYPISSSFFR